MYIHKIEYQYIIKLTRYSKSQDPTTEYKLDGGASNLWTAVFQAC